QLQDAVEQRLGGRRTAGNVDVDGNDPVAAAHDRIAVVVIAAAVRARAHRDDPARLGHLVVDLAQRRRHLVAERPGDDHEVALARARPEQHAEAVDVVARRASVHHLDRAAREAEGHRPQRTGLGPVDQGVDTGGDETFLEYAFNAHDVALWSVARSFPIERTLLPLVREADDE